MRDYAQIIKEAAYTGYDRYTLDFQDDRYMSRLQGEELKHKICELRDSAEKIVLDWLIDTFEEQGYSLESCNNYEGTVSCDMRSEDNNRVEISLHKREKNKFGHADVEVDEWKNQKHECTKFQIKVSTENSRGRHIFRMPQEPYPRTLFPELGKEEECEEWWVRVVCDPKSGEAVELNVYTDPCQLLKKGSIDTIWYESVYEPEKTKDRLPDFFYETMEKKDLENRLISPEVRVLKGRLTSEDDYLYITFDSFYTSYVPYWVLGKSGYEMPMYVRIQRTEDMPFLGERDVMVVLLPCYFAADGVVLWLQIPEIRIEKNGAGLMPAGGFVYV